MPLLLIAAVVVALIVIAVALGVPPEPAAVVLIALSILSLILGLLVAVSVLRPGQARPAFVTDEPSRTLRTPRAGTLPLLNIAMLGILGFVLIVPDTETDILPMTWSLGAFIVVFLGLCARATLTGIGLTISSEGLRADKFAGTVTVPWAAIDPGQIWSGPFEVHLRYRAPELIRTSGWVVNPGKLRVDGVVPEFAAATLRHYAAESDQRELIGTPAGQLHPSSKVGPAPTATSPRGAIVTVLVLAVLIGAGAVAGDLRVGAAYGNASVAGIVAHVVTVAFVLLALRFVRGSMLLLRRRA
ncbi:hypothetical protein L3i22_029560 [Actinoplanes sp. L3-i22]|nr:hypothetical protein L3i22_029560 [Actinoplanes sp. L3-i22]